jgi:Cu/Ag efflux protein CusF
MLVSLVVIASPSNSQVDQTTDGVVKKIDKENSKITIRHDEIKNLDMPPMTMVFQVKNKELLDKVQPGEVVKFTVIQEGGKLVITNLKSAP